MKKNKLKALAAAAVMSGMALLAGCGAQKEPEIPSVLADGKLTVGLVIGEDRSAYKVADGSAAAYAGLEPAILEVLKGKLENIQVDVINVASQEELLKRLDSGDVGLAAGGFENSDLYETKYIPSDYYTFSNLYIVNRGGNYSDTLVNFAEGTIGVSDKVSVSVVSQIVGIEGVSQVSYSDMTRMGADIDAGTILAGVCTESEAVALSEEGYSVMEMRSGPRVPLVFLMGPGQYELQEAVNAAIKDYMDEESRPKVTEEEIGG